MQTMTLSPSLDLLPPPDETALFLDFDGTLVNIAATPDAISVSPDVDRLLCALRLRLSGRIAIVSGRSIDDLRQHIRGHDIVFVGGHGAEVEAPGAKREQILDVAVIPSLHAAIRKVQETYPTLYAEYKTTGAVLHYRQKPEYKEHAWDAARAIAIDHPEFDLQASKMAVELRPRHANKRAAVDRLMQTAPFAGHTPVFAGDDTTDVPAMTYCVDQGGAAIGMGAVDGSPTIRVDTPAELHNLLSHWSIS